MRHLKIHEPKWVDHLAFVIREIKSDAILRKRDRPKRKLKGFEIDPQNPKGFICSTPGCNVKSTRLFNMQRHVRRERVSSHGEYTKFIVQWLTSINFLSDIRDTVP